MSPTRICFSSHTLQAQFGKAMAIAGEEFMERVRYLTTSWLPARDIVVRGMASRQDTHPSGRIVEFATGCPWKVCCTTAFVILV
jgi:uncharacterized UPF0160 family protein